MISAVAAVLVWLSAIVLIVSIALELFKLFLVCVGILLFVGIFIVGYFFKEVWLDKRFKDKD